MKEICASCKGGVLRGGSQYCKIIHLDHRLSMAFLENCLTGGKFMNRNRVHFRSRCLHAAEVFKALGLK